MNHQTRPKRLLPQLGAVFVAVTFMAAACGDSSANLQTTASETTESGVTESLVSLPVATEADCGGAGTQVVQVPPAADPGTDFPLIVSDMAVAGCFLTSYFSCHEVATTIGRSVLTDTFPTNLETSQAAYAPGDPVPDGTLLLILDVSLTNLGNVPPPEAQCSLAAELPNPLFWETVAGEPRDLALFPAGALAVNSFKPQMDPGDVWQGQIALPVLADATTIEIQSGVRSFSGEEPSLITVYELPPRP